MKNTMNIRAFDKKNNVFIENFAINSLGQFLSPKLTDAYLHGHSSFCGEYEIDEGEQDRFELSVSFGEKDENGKEIFKKIR